MKRLIEQTLKQWKVNPRRKPLVLRGARQVGKTYSVRRLGESFDRCVEINFERLPAARSVFNGNLDPRRIVRDLSLLTGQKIEAHRTLLFLDELQETSQGLTALRYFHEELPELHVVAAGSLLEFQIEAHGLPVGRVNFAHMFPMCFAEFVSARGNEVLGQFLLTELPDESISESVHGQALSLLSEYLAIGGMPEAVEVWRSTEDLEACTQVHHQIIQSYRQDFEKFASRIQIPRISHLFDELPHHVARKWKFSNVAGEYRARELRPALELLEKCHIAHSVYHTSAQGLQLGAEIDRKKRKILMLDIGLMQTMLGLDAKSWILSPNAEFASRGSVIESFVGQELLCHLSGVARASLYYWHREARSSNAEVDYVVQLRGQIVPIEVKSGLRGRARSIEIFLDSHRAAPYGVLFSPNNIALSPKLRRYPLYLVGALTRE